MSTGEVYLQAIFHIIMLVVVVAIFGEAINCHFPFTVAPNYNIGSGVSEARESTSVWIDATSKGQVILRPHDCLISTSPIQWVLRSAQSFRVHRAKYARSHSSSMWHCWGCKGQDSPILTVLHALANHALSRRSWDTRLERHCCPFPFCHSNNHRKRGVLAPWFSTRDSEACTHVIVVVDWNPNIGFFFILNFDSVRVTFVPGS